MNEMLTIQNRIYEIRVLNHASISSQFVMTSRAKRPKSALPFVYTERLNITI